MEITVNYPVKKQLKIEQLEAYLIRMGWENQGGHVWYRKSCHTVFSENVQHAINTLEIDEKRASGFIVDDILGGVV